MPEGAILFAAALAVAVDARAPVGGRLSRVLGQGYFDYEFTLADITLGWLVVGYFPLFPWLAFPLAGYALAPALLAGGRAARIVAGWLLAASRWPLLAWGASRRDHRHRPAGWTMFPASTAYCLGTPAR